VTPSGDLVTLAKDAGAGTEVEFAPAAFVGVNPGDLVVSSIPGHAYSAYEEVFSGVLR